MKRIAVLFFVGFFVGASVQAGPIEFFATVVGDPEDGDTELTVRLTPVVETTVLITGLTEIKNQSGVPISLGEIDDGDVIEVEAIHTSGKILALEVEIQDSAARFEVQGPIEEVNVDEDWIQVSGLQMLIQNTEIKDENGDPLTLEELAALPNLTTWVKVEGRAEGDDLIADEVKVQPEGDFARISLEGIITSLDPAAMEMMVDIGGGIEVLVRWTDGETNIRGTLFVGAVVKVQGVIHPDLSVMARSIRVQELCELSPDTLRMHLNDARQVTVILRQALDSDLVISISSADDSIAQPAVAGLMIPAGQRSGTFDVNSFEVAGETTIEVEITAPPELAGLTKTLEVEVGLQGGPRALEIKWTPRQIKKAPNRLREVRLMLKHGFAPEDLIVHIELVDPSPDLDIISPEFPTEVTIPAGEREVRLVLEIMSTTGSGKLRATLPDSVGGHSDELEIDLVPDN